MSPKKHFDLRAACIAFIAMGAFQANAADTPQLKPGLWETKIQRTAGGTSTTTQFCRDAASISHTKELEAAREHKNCTSVRAHNEPGRWIQDSVCKMGPSTVTTHVVTEYSSENAYHVVVTSTFDPPRAGMSGSTTIMDGKWLGPCTAK